ncbi:MAG: hypothetical protein MUF61_03430 [archaeon]|jgi:hypothetical protein|nr:hypothetical protein [archaeon]
MRDDEELPPEEIRQRISGMSQDDAQKYLQTLPAETLNRYGDYVLQRARVILERELTESARRAY